MLDPLRAVALASTATAPLLALPQSIHVVDIDGRGDHFSIQSAVDAAGDGDIVFVMDPQRLFIPAAEEAPLVDGFVIEGKSLTVLARPEVPWSIGWIEIRGLASDQWVCLSGLQVGHDRSPHPGHTNAPYPPFVDAGAPVFVADCAGPVSLQGCSLFGPRRAHALVVDGASCVQVAGSAVRGGWEGHGVLVEDSFVAVSESVVVGGVGSNEDGSCHPGPTDGGDGVRIGPSGALRAITSSFNGGSGGFGDFFPSPFPGCFGAPGSDLVADPTSSLYVLPRESREAPYLICRSLVAHDEPLRLEVQATPLDAVYLLVSESMGFASLGLEVGPLLCDEPIPGGRRLLGVAPLDGTISAALPLPPVR
ncbi:MAG: hypothetical protein AAFP86_03770, partial [Planctomycetota bacterium]